MGTVLKVEDLLLDCGGKMFSGLATTIQSRLAINRAVLLRNTGMAELNEMADWARLIGAKQMDYTGGTDHPKPLGSVVFSAGTEPHFTNIDPHNEMAYWTFYPKQILFGCQSIPARGGETVIADNRRVSEDIIATDTGQKIFDTGVRYIRNFNDSERLDSITSM